MKTLADRVLAGLLKPQQLPKQMLKVKHIALELERTRTALRSARRFTLDDDFVRVASTLDYDKPEVLRSYAMLAELPYDTMWLEWRMQARMGVYADRGTADPLNPQDHDRVHSGFLMRRTDDGMWTARYFQDALFDDQENLEVWWTWAAVFMDPQGRGRDDIPYGLEIETEELVSKGWGYIDRKHSEILAPYGWPIPEPILIRPAIEDYMSTGSAFPKSLADEVAKMFIRGVNEASGDLRFLVVVLAVINRTPLTYRHHSVGGTYQKRLKKLPYLDSNVVTLNTTKTKVVSILAKASRQEQASRRAHQVRGHWRCAERGKAVSGCLHTVVERDGDIALCGKCGNLIRWTPEHQRGDASLGYVVKDYEVKL